MVRVRKLSGGRSPCGYCGTIIDMKMLSILFMGDVPAAGKGVRVIAGDMRENPAFRIVARGLLYGILS